MSNQIQAVARVQVTVEVDTSAWSENCSIGQLVADAVMEMIRAQAEAVVDHLEANGVKTYVRLVSEKSTLEDLCYGVLASRPKEPALDFQI